MRLSSRRSRGDNSPTCPAFRGSAATGTTSGAIRRGASTAYGNAGQSDNAEARTAPTEDASTILDEPGLAEGLEYFRLGSFSVSNGGSLLAYSADTDGSERFRMVVKDLNTGEFLGEEIEGTIGSAVWAADDASFFYTLVDENWRPWQVRRHVLGETVDNDSVVYEETDSGFFVGLSVTTSKEYIIIGSGDHVTSEIRLIPATHPDSPAILVSPRRTGHEYSVDHQERPLRHPHQRHPQERSPCYRARQ